ncbi:MAG: AAA family ATPase [Bdellovibrionota bacterium]
MNDEMKAKIHTFLLEPDTYWQLEDKANKATDKPQKKAEKKIKSAVEFKETHISLVYLTKNFVYKMKKDACYDFLDFSTYEKRLAACQDELFLNKRLAPDTYLQIVFITINTSGELEINGAGKKIEPVIMMKRLPAHLMLDQLISSDKLTVAQLQQLSSFLSDFYMAQHPILEDADAYLTYIHNHVEQNRTVLLDNAAPHIRDKIRAAHSAQLMFLDLEEDQLRQRVENGHIIHGHGDLRPEHICLQPSMPVIFDCIEFNREFATLDVLDELSFLAVECEHMGNEECGNYILHAYKERSHDFPKDPRLAEFYKSYRASVRAKIAAIRYHQTKDFAVAKHQAELVDHYCNIAYRHACRLQGKWVFVIGGGMGTGKSTLAEAIAKRYGAELLQTDAIRKELFSENSEKNFFGEGLYTQENRQSVYQELIRRLDDLLDRGLTVVLDGSFLSETIRHQVEQTVEKYTAHYRLIWCHCDNQISKERISKRLASGKSLSEARPELVENLLQEGTIPIGPDILAIETSNSLAKELAEIKAGLMLRKS